MRKRLSTIIVGMGIIAMVFLLSGIHCGEDNQRVEFAASSKPGEIVFQTDGVKGVFRLDTNTLRVTRLSESSFVGDLLAVSPDGQTVVGQSYESYESKQDLTLRDCNSSLERQLIPDAGTYTHPVHSKDGTSVFFVKKGDDTGTGESGQDEVIYSVSAGGGVPVKVFPTRFQSVNSIEPLGNTDHLLIVAAKANQRMDAFLVSIEGEPRSISLTNFGTVSDAKVSADGTKLLVVNHLSGSETFDLYVCRLEPRANLIGAHQKPIVTNLKGLKQVIWSTDGSKITYVLHNPNGDPELWQMLADGKLQHKIAGKELFHDPTRWKAPASSAR